MSVHRPARDGQQDTLGVHIQFAMSYRFTAEYGARVVILGYNSF